MAWAWGVLIVALCWVLAGPWFVMMAFRLWKGNRCCCGAVELDFLATLTSYSVEDEPVFVHEEHRCYPYLEEVV